MSARAAAIAVLLACSFGVTPARAQEEAAATPEADARALFDEGRSLVAAGSYDEAIAKFEESLALVDNPATAVNLGIALAHAGRLTDAIERFEALLASDVLSAAQREDLSRRLAEARDAMARVLVRVRGVDSAEVFIDERRVGTVTGETAAIFLVDPGVHEVSVRAADGRAWESRRVDLALGAEEEMSFDAADLAGGGATNVEPDGDDGDPSILDVEDGADADDDGGVGVGWWVAGGLILAAVVAVAVTFVVTSASSGPPVVGSAITLSTGP